MRPAKCLCFGFMCAVACGWMAPLAAQQEIINEDFDDGDFSGVSLVGSAQVIDDGCGGNNVLSLT
jgi:hypothetical protein